MVGSLSPECVCTGKDTGWGGVGWGLQEPSPSSPLSETQWGVDGGRGPPCRMSIIRNGNVTLSNLRKPRVTLLILRKHCVALAILKKVSCQMLLRPKKGSVAVSILGVYTPIPKIS